MQFLQVSAILHQPVNALHGKDCLAEPVRVPALAGLPIPVPFLGGNVADADSRDLALGLFGGPIADVVVVDTIEVALLGDDLIAAFTDIEDDVTRLDYLAQLVGECFDNKVARRGNSSFQWV